MFPHPRLGNWLSLYLVGVPPLNLYLPALEQNPEILLGGLHVCADVFGASLFLCQTISAQMAEMKQLLMLSLSAMQSDI